MTDPTAADVARARELVSQWSLQASRSQIAEYVAQALAAAREQERARCVALVQQGRFSFQSDPPLPITVERLEGLRAQLVAALARETPGTS